MLKTMISAAAAFVTCFALAPPSPAHAESELRITGPVVHENLAVYLIRGASRPGPVPLTLQEALEAKLVEVREIQQVNTLEVENIGDREIFIQAGDIVKGGQQDRVLTSSLILPSRSGAVRIDSYCVEQGRWSQRAGESVQKFEKATAALPSRAGRLALAGVGAAPEAPRPPVLNGTRADRRVVTPPPSRQQEVWREVATIQDKLTRNLAAPVAAARSSTSLQLSLENDGLRKAEEAYLRVLEPIGTQDEDVVGYAIAVNGKIAIADVYPSNGLFRKMWPKLLRAHVTEAIGEKDKAAGKPPATDAVQAFLGAAQHASATERAMPTKGSVEIRESDSVVFQEAKPAATLAAPAAAPAWAHRSYLAK